jgi:zinc transport system permease protein
MADTLSHVSLAGVAFGILLSLDTTFTTLIIVILAAVFLEYLQTIYRNYMEVATAILMSAGLAIALLIMSGSTGKTSISLDQYLFGSIVTITTAQVWLLFGLAAFVLLGFMLFLRPLYVMTFDEDTAFVDGLPVRLISLTFNIVTGLAIALMIPAAGALLVSAIMVLPASIAMRLGKSFRAVLAIAVGISFLGMNAGLVASYYMNAPASASITLIFILFFLLVSAFKSLARR